ncbi:hypothetical protein AVEN_203489-1 [Araneus ventricosus]|uniref:Uncharacterized protein n=1 Tax=Araneus ventricosus TaxID=182803 RepID=A0A4Y2BHY4_ARAVE|nr:hypothetical protein AVEN_203489-1 [Araneus ventricosus]
MEQKKAATQTSHLVRSLPTPRRGTKFTCIDPHWGSKMPGGPANEMFPPIRPIAGGMEKILLENTVSIRPHCSHEKEPHPWIDTVYRLVRASLPRRLS